MIEQSLLLKLSSPEIIDDTTSRLRKKYKANQSLFQAQPAVVQQYLGNQAAKLAEAVAQEATKVQFTLPEVVACGSGLEAANNIASIPKKYRERSVGGWLAKLTHPSLLVELDQRLEELAEVSNQAVSVAAGLLRYAIAIHMVYNMLPAGKLVIYASVEGDDIPNKPVERVTSQETAFTSIEDTSGSKSRVEIRDDEPMIPYADAVQNFYLPQWVAFNEHGQLLTSSVTEAEGYITFLLHYLTILQSAITLAPYMIADETWQQKRYGALGQLVNQGRAYANFELQEIIHEVLRRVEAHQLDRGLRLSLPYFDDQKLGLDKYEFTVVPRGWVMFVPAFVVLAARQQQIKVAGDARLSIATRRHLLTELNILERAFLR